MSTSEADKGVLYIASGDEFVAEATRSAKSVRREYPNIHITIITDVKDVPEVFDSRMPLEDPDYSNLDKVTNISRTPYNKTVFLDTDTCLLEKEGLTDIFELLEEFEFAAVQGIGLALNLPSGMV